MLANLWNFLAKRNAVALCNSPRDTSSTPIQNFVTTLDGIQSFSDASPPSPVFIEPQTFSKSGKPVVPRLRLEEALLIKDLEQMECSASSAQHLLSSNTSSSMCSVLSVSREHQGNTELNIQKPKQSLKLQSKFSQANDKLAAASDAVPVQPTYQQTDSTAVQSEESFIATSLFDEEQTSHKAQKKEPLGRESGNAMKSCRKSGTNHGGKIMLSNRTNESEESLTFAKVLASGPSPEMLEKWYRIIDPKNVWEGEVLDLCWCHHKSLEEKNTEEATKEAEEASQKSAVDGNLIQANDGEPAPPASLTDAIRLLFRDFKIKPFDVLRLVQPCGRLLDMSDSNEEFKISSPERAGAILSPRSTEHPSTEENILSTDLEMNSTPKRKMKKFLGKSSYIKEDVQHRQTVNFSSKNLERPISQLVPDLQPQKSRLKSRKSSALQRHTVKGTYDQTSSGRTPGNVEAHQRPLRRSSPRTTYQPVARRRRRSIQPAQNAKSTRYVKAPPHDEDENLLPGILSTFSYITRNVMHWINITVINSESMDSPSKRPAQIKPGPSATRQLKKPSDRSTKAAVSLGKEKRSQRGPMNGSQFESQKMHRHFSKGAERMKAKLEPQQVQVARSKRSTNIEDPCEDCYRQHYDYLMSEDPGNLKNMSFKYKKRFWYEVPIPPVRKALPESTLWQSLWHVVDPRTKDELHQRHIALVSRAGHPVITRQTWNPLLPDITKNFWRNAATSHIELSIFSVENIPYVGQIILETGPYRISMPFNCRFLRIPYMSHDQVLTLWFNSPVGRSQRRIRDDVHGSIQGDWIGSGDDDDMAPFNATNPANADEDAMTDQQLQDIVDRIIHSRSHFYHQAPVGHYTPAQDYLTWFKLEIPVASLVTQSVEDSIALDPKGYYYDMNPQKTPEQRFEELRRIGNTAIREPLVKLQATLVLQGIHTLITTGDAPPSHILELQEAKTSAHVLLQRKVVYVSFSGDPIDEMVGIELNRNDQSLLKQISLDAIKRMCKGKYLIHDCEVDISIETILPDVFNDFDFTEYPSISGFQYATGQFQLPIVHYDGIHQPLREFLKKKRVNHIIDSVERQKFDQSFIYLKHLQDKSLSFLRIHPHNLMFPYELQRSPQAVNALHNHMKAILINLGRLAAPSDEEVSPLNAEIRKALAPVYLQLHRNSLKQPMTLSFEDRGILKLVAVKLDSLPAYLDPCAQVNRNPAVASSQRTEESAIKSDQAGLLTDILEIQDFTADDSSASKLHPFSDLFLNRTSKIDSQSAIPAYRSEKDILKVAKAPQCISKSMSDLPAKRSAASEDVQSKCATPQRATLATANTAVKQENPQTSAHQPKIPLQRAELNTVLKTSLKTPGIFQALTRDSRGPVGALSTAPNVKTRDAHLAISTSLAHMAPHTKKPLKKSVLIDQIPQQMASPEQLENLSDASGEVFQEVTSVLPVKSKVSEECQLEAVLLQRDTKVNCSHKERRDNPQPKEPLGLSKSAVLNEQRPNIHTSSLLPSCASRGLHSNIAPVNNRAQTQHEMLLKLRTAAMDPSGNLLPPLYPSTRQPLFFKEAGAVQASCAPVNAIHQINENSSMSHTVFFGQSTNKISPQQQQPLQPIFCKALPASQEPNEGHSLPRDSTSPSSISRPHCPPLDLRRLQTTDPDKENAPAQTSQSITTVSSNYSTSRDVNLLYKGRKQKQRWRPSVPKEFLECTNDEEREQFCRRILKEQKINKVVKSHETDLPIEHSYTYVDGYGQIIIPEDPPLPHLDTLKIMNAKQRKKLKGLRKRFLAQHILELEQERCHASKSYQKLLFQLEEFQLTR